MQVRQVALAVLSGDEFQGITRVFIRLGDHDSCPELADGSEFGVETVFAPGLETGDLVIDSSGNKSYFPIGVQPRTFGSWNEFYDFAANQLNAELVFDDAGQVVGVQGKTIEWGHSIYVDPRSGQLMEVTDPVAAFLGGFQGQIVVNGERIPISSDFSRPWDSTLPDDPGQRDICAGSFCTRNTSFKNDYFIYASRGSETSQLSGGYHVTAHFCWKWGFIPWVCWSGSGYNHFDIWNVYYMFNPPSPWWYRSAGATNVSSLTESVWAIRYLGIVGQLTGVCGTHSSWGTGGAPPNVNTAAGASSDCPL
jgi:hypothetical protein